MKTKLTLRQQLEQARQARYRSHNLWRSVNGTIVARLETGIRNGYSRKRIADQLDRIAGPKQRNEPTCLINLRGAARSIRDGGPLCLL